MNKLPHDHGTSTEFLEARPSEETFGKASDAFSLIGDSTKYCGCFVTVRNV